MKAVAGALVLALLCGGVSCTLPLSRFEGGRVKIDPKGERIEIVTRSGKIVEGEFLFDDGETIYVLAGRTEDSGRTSDIARADVGELTVKGLTNRSWIPWVIGLQIIPAVLLGAASESVNKGSFVEVAGRASIWGVVTGLIFAVGGKADPALKGTILPLQFVEFRKYSRYPFAPDEELKQKILDSLKKK
jgi:hypothetical protein